VRAAKQENMLETHKVAISMLSLNDYKPIKEFSNGTMKINSKFCEALTRDIKLKSPAGIFCSVGGGDHVVLGLVANPRPFDFIVPNDFVEHAALNVPGPFLTSKPTDEIIPFNLMVATMRWRIGGLEFFLKWLKSITELPVYVLCVPPIIGSESFIRHHPVGFAEQISQYGIGPRKIRYKLWWLQAALQKQISQTCGAVFLPAPPAAINHDGCLRQEYYSKDAVHANAEYGALIIGQLATFA
jgi:hypothetical protein